MDKPFALDKMFVALTSGVERALGRYQMIPDGSRVLVGVSGGADSVALFLALYSLSVKHRYDLSVVHVEHGIRGQDSIDDAMFVSDLCNSYEVPLFIEHVDVPSALKEFGTGIEDTARRLRYDAFERVASRIGADRVALAHHMDDQAETVLLHLIRGCGIRGLCGMPYVRGLYVRPLLDTEPSAIYGALESLGQTFRTDMTNFDKDQPRAYIRHEILPRLKGLNPSVVQAMAQTASLAAVDDSYMEGIAKERYQELVKDTDYGYVITGPFDMDRAIASRIIRLLPTKLDFPQFERSHIEGMLTLAPNGRRNLPGGWSAKRSANRLHIIRPASSRKVAMIDFDVKVQAAGQGEHGDGIMTQIIPQTLYEAASWRTRKAGDWWIPFGMKGRRLLSDSLIDRKIDEPYRDFIPLFTMGSEILWAVGVGASERLRRDENTGETYLMLQYNATTPWAYLTDKAV